MKQKRSANRLNVYRWLIAGLVGCLLIVSVVGRSVRTHASSLAEGFVASGSFSAGLLVSTSNAQSDILELATLNNSNYLFGVVQTQGDGLVNFNRDGANVSVATSGVVAAYVTDANGEVKKGDYIGPSWIDGVGMKAQEGDDHKVLGVALEDFDSSSAKDFSDIKTAGGTKTVKVGSVALRLSGVPNKQLMANESGVSGFTAKLVGRQVAFTRVVVAFLVFFITIIISALFIRTSIKNSFISIGRNPMASKPIYRSLLQVSIVSMIMILVGTAAAYAVVVL